MSTENRDQLLLESDLEKAPRDEIIINDVSIFMIYDMDNIDMFYIGTTTYPLKVVLSKQIWTAFNNPSSGSLLHNAIRNNNRYDRWCIKLLKKFDEIKIGLLRMIERAVIDESKPPLNIRRPYVTDEESKLQIDMYSGSRVLCECGVYYGYRNKTNHIRTSKHKKRMEELKQQS